MKEVAIEICGTKEETDGSLTTVSATVFSPVKTDGHNEHYCVIHCPHVFDNDKKIFGVDADQALELSIMFIKDMLEHDGVVLKEKDCPTTPND